MVKKLQSERPEPLVAAGDSFTHSPIQPFNSSLQFLNRQRTRRLDLVRLRRVADGALTELGVRHCNLTFYFVGAKRMAQINETHLGHPGPTDVITFDYADAPSNAKLETRNSKPAALHGEIFICVDVAVTQAREFRTTWQAEVARYLIHGLLHLCGHDDLTPAPRRRMKQVENRLVRKLASFRQPLR